MTEAKHTPGPWFVHGPSVGTGPSEADSCGYEVAHILNPYKGCVGARDRVDANARLIAAAPELLEALEKTQILLERMGMQSSDEYQENRAAIAKATGQQS